MSEGSYTSSSRSRSTGGSTERTESTSSSSRGSTSTGSSVGHPISIGSGRTSSVSKGSSTGHPISIGSGRTSSTSKSSSAGHPVSINSGRTSSASKGSSAKSPDKSPVKCSKPTPSTQACNGSDNSSVETTASDRAAVGCRANVGVCRGPDFLNMGSKGAACSGQGSKNGNSATTACSGAKANNGACNNTAAPCTGSAAAKGSDKATSKTANQTSCAGANPIPKTACKGTGATKSAVRQCKPSSEKVHGGKILKRGPGRGLFVSNQSPCARKRRAPVRFGIHEHIEGST